MKLIIDIPEAEYEDVKKTGGCYYDFGKAIINGVPLGDVMAAVDALVDEISKISNNHRSG